MQSLPAPTIQLNQLRSFDSDDDEQEEYDKLFEYSIQQTHLLTTQSNKNFYAIDTLKLPQIPMRRKQCHICFTKALSCQQCPSCSQRKVICCRGFYCVYDWTHYTKDKNKEIYQQCHCIDKDKVSRQSFFIDWRLLSLLNKVNLATIDYTKYSYQLLYEGGVLSLAENKINSRQLHTERHLFEDSFTMKTQTSSSYQLRELNVSNLKDLIKEAVRRHLLDQQSCQTSNLQNICNDVKQKILANPKFAAFMSKLVNEQQLANNHIRSMKKLQNVQILTGIVNQQIFQGLSRVTNSQIQFFFHPCLEKMFIISASYQKLDQTQILRVYKIDKQNQLGSLEKAVWFKDRKGDIFSIKGEILSVFKFDLKTKMFKQIILRNDPLFSRINNAESLVYVAQTDRVYYFDSERFELSFYFELYRPAKEEKYFSSCLSANSLVILSSQFKPKNLPPFFYATYILEQENTKKNVPVIYLLGYKKNYIPLPLCIYCVRHQEGTQVKIKELISTQGEFEQGTMHLDFENGLLGVFKKEKTSTICLYTKLNGCFSLIEGRILDKDKIQWRFYEVPFYIQGQKKKQLSLQIKKLPNQSFKQLQEHGTNKSMSLDDSKKEIVWINDVAGRHSNNSTTFFGFLSSSMRPVEINITLFEGNYSVTLSL